MGSPHTHGGGGKHPCSLQLPKGIYNDGTGDLILGGHTAGDKIPFLSSKLPDQALDGSLFGL